jgi:threonine/homoserine/homoserine lactone efflux protein
MRFVGIPPYYVFVTIVLQFVQEGSEVIDESITWVVMATFLSSACFCWCQVAVIALVAGGWGQTR